MNTAKELDLAIRLAESISENEDTSNKKEINTSNSIVRKLSCHKEGFCFEKKLPTTVGGTTSFDGFLEEDARNLFVVSKSSEPYSKKKSSASFSFGELYEFINAELLGELARFFLSFAGGGKGIVQNAKFASVCHGDLLSKTNIHVDFTTFSAKCQGFFTGIRKNCHLYFQIRKYHGIRWETHPNFGKTAN